jgi:colanic acid/amylovoran biosynthesis glycosyltransferase
MMRPLRAFTRARNRAYTDGDLTFFMLVYRDFPLANRSLARLRRHFPAARVVVRSDGDDDPRHEQLIARYGVEYHREPRLFPVENGGAIVARMLQIYLEHPTRYLIKLDTDTVVHRRFRHLPTRDALFGTLQGGRGWRSIQGGCMGLTRSVAERILGSGLLCSEDLEHPERRRDLSPYWRILARRAERVGLVSFDWSLAWVASETGIPQLGFSEVQSRARTGVDNRDLRYALTHPGRAVLMGDTSAPGALADLPWTIRPSGDTPPMRIAMIVSQLGRLSEKFILDQIVGLIELGHHVEIFARRTNGATVVHPDVDRFALRERLHVLAPSGRGGWRRALKTSVVALETLRHRPLSALRAVLRRDWDALSLLAKARDRDFDLVVAQFGPNGELAARVKGAAGQWPLATIFRGYDVRRALEHGAAIYRTLFARGDLFLGVSQEIVRELDRLGLPPEKILHHPSGVDLGCFHAAADRSWSPAERLVLLTVARLHPVKGLANGIRALRTLLRRRPDLLVEYRLVGEGPQEKELRELVGSEGLDAQVAFLGPLPADCVAAQYRQAHLFVLPSLAEGLPVAVQEAMASELPVVASAVGGVPELVVDGETGRLVPPNDVEALADALEWLIERSDAWQRMGRCARRRVAERYALRKQNQELERICWRLVMAARANKGTIGGAFETARWPAHSPRT